MRLVLAATLSPSYGIYSGYELCENAALPGREEYLDSEKYEIRPRHWDAAGNLNDFITLVNLTRRQNPALHHLTNLRFLDIDNEQMIAFVKTAARSFERRHRDRESRPHAGAVRHRGGPTGGDWRHSG